MKGRIVSVAVDAIRISEKTCWIFVTIRSEDGFAGIGETSLAGQEGAVLAEITARAQALIGVPVEPELGAPPQVGALSEAAARSAVSQALWDLAARRKGVGLATELGGQVRSRVPLYANINRRTTDRSPEGFAATARAALAAGHVAFKLAPFDEVTPACHRDGTVAQGTEMGLARAAAVRDAVGPDLDVMIDCHWRFDENSAADMIPRAAKIGLVWIECPIREDIGAIPALRRLRGLANRHGMRLAGCEELVGLKSFMPYIAGGAYDVLMPDVKYCGGPAEMLRIAEALRSHGVAFSPHNPSGPICHAASLGVCAAVGEIDRLETQFDESRLFSELLKEPMPPCVDGESALPSGPGIGSVLDPVVVARSRLASWSGTVGVPPS